MGLVERVRQWIRGPEPTLVDYDAYERQGLMTPADGGGAGAAGAGGGGGGGDSGYNPVLGKVGPGSGTASGTAGVSPATTYKIQQSYDSLLQTVQELRAALDGQARRQDELLARLSTLPAAAEALPQASKMQADMLKMINDRLAMHAQQQRQVTDVVNALGPAKKDHAETLTNIRDQIEMGNEIDRQLVESFNRFSMMIDRLQLANQHAVEALQQVRDSYAASAMQMQEWIEKSRHRNGWMIGGAFFMAAAALAIVLVLAYNLSQQAAAIAH
ncbi:MAG TPA: hypothetical protein VHQ47_16575 [Phycisphaerae bacterium]|nr:hypothetical protein [Phycisphaerae bacterium]